MSVLSPLGNQATSYSYFVIPVLTEIDELLKAFVFQGYEALSSYLKIPVSLLASFYLILTGVAMALGWIKFSMGELTHKILKIGFITTAVLNWSMVSEYFVDLINHSIQEIGDVLVTASPIKIGEAGDLNDAMQLVLTCFTRLGTVLFNSGGFGNFGGYLDGVIIWGFGYILIACALFEIVLAKVMLAILFVLTPLMALAYFFKPFYGLFSRWLGLIFGAALMQIFVQAVAALGMSLSYWWVGSHEATDALKIGNFGTLPIIIICLICIGMIHKAAQMGLYIGSAMQVLISESPLSITSHLFTPASHSSHSSQSHSSQSSNTQASAHSSSISSNAGLGGAHHV